MRPTRLFFAAVIMTSLGACIRDQTEVATITLDYLTSAQAQALAEPYLSSDGKLFRSESALNTITVRDRRENVRKVQNLLNQRDASPQNVSLHFQVVRATRAGGVDPQLAKVAGALRELLRFEGYELIAQTVVSASERRVVEQSINAGAMPLQLGVRINDVAGGEGSVDMEVDLRRAGYSSLLTTNVVVPMGQTVVLGSAYPGSDGEALILTVRGERGSTKLRSSSRRNRDEDAHVIIDGHGDAAAHTEAAHAEAAHAAAAAAAHADIAIGRSTEVLRDLKASEAALRELDATLAGTRARTRSTVGGESRIGQDTKRVVPRADMPPAATRSRVKTGPVPPSSQQ